MENVQPFHDTLTLERFFKAKAAKVFEAFKKPELKSQWFIAPSDYTVSERIIEFRIGGRETLRGSFAHGMTTSYEALYYDIVENQRIIYAYDLLINGNRYSVSLATVEFREENGGTRILFTEQNTYVHAPKDAHESRKQGISWHLDNLTKLLASS